MLYNSTWHDPRAYRACKTGLRCMLPACCADYSLHQMLKSQQRHETFSLGLSNQQSTRQLLVSSSQLRTNSTHASHLCTRQAANSSSIIMVNTSPEDEADGLSSFIVPKRWKVDQQDLAIHVLSHSIGHHGLAYAACTMEQQHQPTSPPNCKDMPTVSFSKLLILLLQHVLLHAFVMHMHTMYMLWVRTPATQA